MLCVPGFNGPELGGETSGDVSHQGDYALSFTSCGDLEKALSPCLAGLLHICKSEVVGTRRCLRWLEHSVILWMTPCWVSRCWKKRGQEESFQEEALEDVGP